MRGLKGSEQASRYSILLSILTLCCCSLAIIVYAIDKFRCARVGSISLDFVDTMRKASLLITTFSTTLQHSASILTFCKFVGSQASAASLTDVASHSPTSCYEAAPNNVVLVDSPHQPSDGKDDYRSLPTYNRDGLPTNEVEAFMYATPPGDREAGTRF